jgi:hypothetical protein
MDSSARGMKNHPVQTANSETSEYLTMDIYETDDFCGGSSLWFA